MTRTLLHWYDANRRELVWRTPSTGAWGVLLSEVMSQQTPVRRVEPVWCEWMERWPTPADLAAAGTDEVLRAWGRLGYPRRALRLQDCAAAITARHDGRVPDDVDELLALPGIGDYTARAVAAFAYGKPVPVVDTNVRRVYRRLVDGRFLAGSPRRRDLADVASILPSDPDLVPRFSVALMELGALVCTAARPDCDGCPVRSRCAWRRAGCPAPTDAELGAAKKRVQKFEGTDRQVRGKIMAVLRDADGPVDRSRVDAVWPDAEQRARALLGLLTDGLAEELDDGRITLPRRNPGSDR
ncbi:A/G-specific adenine glycosylase [Corynebacterium pygosceleis]|uniref:Adenine DNA glycosylase n=1 Tax=Corynebacterium pygosceleis TaxID=2800406 RepID=A0A9Q4C9L7_9CORY|nr:A/G-specific adenine glycosylase [Corynebacterium pygosceleis]MCK7638428.1 A/G-specific adenine glycosylase [Corynebacterium pygosceleis]MCK7675408.1 A/G-specific adenine glycosylase [Corynebacterium pygosceleis]MCL0121198.1 A/G-specific adenine glycosylase [Corynebacterium pygosceleis]MCX7445412.1 A/G-specific adenine glycosylase [Corynebacterium pygosceleis]MCX7469092.1 A/G-specific adenine glycosylase [Corynebacterium pygosceleis]